MSEHEKERIALYLTVMTAIVAWSALMTMLSHAFGYPTLI